MKNIETHIDVLTILFYSKKVSEKFPQKIALQITLLTCLRRICKTMFLVCLPKKVTDLLNYGNNAHGKLGKLHVFTVIISNIFGI